MVTLCVLLWALPGSDDLLIDYEDEVLTFLPGHHGRLIQRVRRVEATDAPLEVQIIEFASEQDFAGFMEDPARLALASLRDRAVEKTEIFRVESR